VGATIVTPFLAYETHVHHANIAYHVLEPNKKKKEVIVGANLIIFMMGFHMSSAQLCTLGPTLN